MRLAAARIEAFHKAQMLRSSEGSWSYTDGDDVTLGQRTTPLERVGIYVPGGKAPYPSTVLMNAVPARVAGVGEIVMVTPPGKAGKGAKVNPYILAAASVAGVDRVYADGGAQAIAALAYGTRSIPKVDKITGPGNIYVATAKRLVFGAVDIDMVAGPSEVLILNDGTGEASWIASDILSQAEHDEMAASILVTTSETMARAVKKEVAAQLKKLTRKRIAGASIAAHGTIVVTKTLGEAVKLVNRIAPEHLQIITREAADVADEIRNAGAVFIGPCTPVATGDYLAGTNHTLPTGGTARFSSPLGVEDFLKRTSVVEFSPEALATLGGPIERFAAIEGFDGHGKSVSIRVKKTKRS